MGSKIFELFETKELEVKDLSGKTLAVDAFNTLYMFLTTIRGYDGAPLMDTKGNITSHIQGLITRFSKYQEQGIKFIFVFDGKSHELKSEESKRRKELKEQAKELYNEAKKEQDVENMKKYAARTVFLTDKMVLETKQLLDILGIPWVQAPSEGEAQAAFLVKQGKAYAVLSQDADSLLNEAPRLIKNLSISSKRKLPGSLGYKETKPELIELKDNLDLLGLTQKQLICLAILVGTDYNYSGVKGIGPKKALKLLKKHGENFEEVFKDAKWDEFYDFSWKKIFEVFSNMPHLEDTDIKFGKPKLNELEEFLKEKDFSENRINLIIKRYKEISSNTQKDLSSFFLLF